MAQFTIKLRNPCSGGEHAQLQVSGSAAFTADISRAQITKNKELVQGLNNADRMLVFIELYRDFHNLTDNQIINTLASVPGAVVSITSP